MAHPKRDWRTDEDDLMAHVHGYCFDGRGGIGCADCMPGYDHYTEGGNAYPENVADIPGVTFIPAR